MNHFTTVSKGLTRHKGESVFHEDFLLQTEWAQKLYHGYAASMPIIDYHNHLSPEYMAIDFQYQSITDLWLEGDHYKWRAMRANGVPEEYIMGKAQPEAKFQKWAETVPYTLRNPLFHWSHMELKKTFGVETYLNGGNASEIYNHCNQVLNNGLTVQQILKSYKVNIVCTTDDPIDDLRYHKAMAKNPTGITALPTFRPDKAIEISRGKLFVDYLEQLSAASQIEINSFESLLEALTNRHSYFQAHGCKVMDIGLSKVPSNRPEKLKADVILKKVLNGKSINYEESLVYQATILHELGILNADNGWIQQFHIGPVRNNNSRMLIEYGPDGGFDSMSDENQIEGLSTMLDELEMKEKLTKTIAYNLHPALNDAFATMLGNFNDGSSPGKMQYGAAWWFLDQKKGVENQLDTLSNMGLLSRFVGMLTDSRSFVSFSRHDYFRRILCNVLGNEIASGELPSDEHWVGGMVQDICYNNALNYFDFD